jgi:hypothetical protein
VSSFLRSRWLDGSFISPPFHLLHAIACSSFVSETTVWRNKPRGFGLQLVGAKSTVVPPWRRLPQQRRASR